MKLIKLAVIVPVAATLAALGLSFAPCQAVPITPFSDTDSYIERAQDIVIAKCISSEVADRPWFGNLYPAEVDVISVLKGDRKPGALKVVTIYSVEPGKNYLLASTGRSAYESDFVALGELSVMPVPPDIIKELEGKPIKEQVQRIFARRLCDVQMALDPLERERDVLCKGLSDRDYDLYTSPTEVRIDKTYTASAEDHDENRSLYLHLNTATLRCGARHEGSKTGNFYYCQPLGRMVWEFSRSPNTSISDFEGKVLNTRFEGGCPQRAGITVKVGEIILARRTDAPSVIYIIKLLEQEKERLVVNYAVVGD